MSTNKTIRSSDSPCYAQSCRTDLTTRYFISKLNYKLSPIPFFKITWLASAVMPVLKAISMFSTIMTVGWVYSHDAHLFFGSNFYKVRYDAKGQMLGWWILLVFGRYGNNADYKPPSPINQCRWMILQWLSVFNAKMVFDPTIYYNK